MTAYNIFSFNFFKSIPMYSTIELITIITIFVHYDITIRVFVAHSFAN